MDVRKLSLEQLQSGLQEVQKLAIELGGLIEAAKTGRDKKNRLKAVRIACRRLAMPRPIFDLVEPPTDAPAEDHNEFTRQLFNFIDRKRKDANQRKAARAKLRKAGGVYGER